MFYWCSCQVRSAKEQHVKPSFYCILILLFTNTNVIFICGYEWGHLHLHLDTNEGSSWSLCCVRYQLNHYNTKHMQRDRAWYTCTMQDTLRGWKYSRIQRRDLAQNNRELTILNIRKFDFLISNTCATIEYFVEVFMINVI